MLGSLGYPGCRAISAIPLLQDTDVQLIRLVHCHCACIIVTTDMALSLEGKIAIITGASRLRGIGAQVAYELAKRGAKVG